MELVTVVGQVWRVQRMERGREERAKERKGGKEREAKSRTMLYNTVATCGHLILFK